MGIDLYEVTTPPAEYPVTLAEAKEACRITHSAEDDLITALIQAATLKLETYTNRIFIERSITGYFQSLACSKWEKNLFLMIRRAPLISVDTVEVTENDAQTSVTTDEYDVKVTAAFPRIIFNGEGSYSPDRIPYPWQVEFQAGYGAAADVPEAIKLIIMQFVCFLYRNRGDCADAPAMPQTVKAFADEYRILNTFG